MLYSLNERFRNGRPHNSYSQAGVMLHTLDFVDGAGSRDNVWRPGVTFNGRIYNRLSASMVNAKLPHFFNERAGGTRMR